MDKQGITQEELRMLLNGAPEKNEPSVSPAAEAVPFPSRLSRSRARVKRKWWNLFR